MIAEMAEQVAHHQVIDAARRHFRRSCLADIARGPHAFHFEVFAIAADGRRSCPPPLRPATRRRTLIFSFSRLAIFIRFRTRPRQAQHER